MKNQERYCCKCGAREVSVECADYDINTGKKVWRNTCPTVGCEINCDFYGHEYKSMHWWCYKAKCIKCGYIPQDY